VHSTVHTYSSALFCTSEKRAAMRPALRQHYRPDSLRVPVWLRRVWAWF
jgi:hypothetical protein